MVENNYIIKKLYSCDIINFYSKKIIYVQFKCHFDAQHKSVSNHYKINPSEKNKNKT